MKVSLYEKAMYGKSKPLSSRHSDGTIAAVGLDSEVAGMFPGASWAAVIDARGRSVVPGLVDAHTHPVWAGDRVHEFAMKVRK